jgi:hypothetical protein
MKKFGFKHRIPPMKRSDWGYGEVALAAAPLGVIRN